jgi:hypothetical protein
MKRKADAGTRTAPECYWPDSEMPECRNADASGNGLDADAQLWLCDEGSINADQVRFSFVNNQAKKIVRRGCRKAIVE